MYFKCIFSFFCKAIVAILLIDCHKSVLLTKTGTNIAQKEATC